MEGTVSAMSPMIKSVRTTAVVAGAFAALLTTGTALAKDHGDDDHGDHDRGHRPAPARTVPEISGKYAGAALALVLGGAAVVLGRRRRKVA
jgi:hypothetical protein